MKPDDPLTQRVIGAAIDVHRSLGPGLLESAYEECLCSELKQAGILFKRQVPLPVEYKSVRLECGYRMDLVVQDALIVEIKTVERLLPIHEAQLLTYLKLSKRPTGLLLNFHTAALRDGIRRMSLSREAQP
jgi:GxxExxY protein